MIRRTGRVEGSVACFAFLLFFFLFLPVNYVFVGRVRLPQADQRISRDQRDVSPNAQGTLGRVATGSDNGVVAGDAETNVKRASETDTATDAAASVAKATHGQASDFLLPSWWPDHIKQISSSLLDEVALDLLRQQSPVNFSLEVTEPDIENFNVKLPELLPTTRSPCWVEIVPETYSYNSSLFSCQKNQRDKIIHTLNFLSRLIGSRKVNGTRWRLRCFPSFFLIGVGNSGTSDLIQALVKHPQLIQAEVKDTDFWSRQRFAANPIQILTDHCPGYKSEATFADYLDSYDSSAEAVLRSSRRRENGSFYSDVIFGDYSTHTLQVLYKWDPSLSEPTHTTAHHLAHILPSLKFIVILRDPVERAFSRYRMRFSRRQNVAGTQADFHKLMMRQMTGVERCKELYSLRACVYQDHTESGGYHNLLVNGLYVLYLRDWLGVFPRDQLKVLLFEDYSEQRLAIVEETTKFLELDDLPVSVKANLASMPVQNAGPRLGEMLPETREMLREFYRPYNLELAELLQEERFTWGY